MVESSMVNHRRRLRWLLAGLGVFLVVVAIPEAADAHPLGNFTVNRYARIEPTAEVVRITYILDQAEIPTFQEQRVIDADPDGFALRRADQIAAGLRLSVDGQLVRLQQKNYLLTEPPGQGGLRVLRLAIIYEAPAPISGRFHDASFTDTNESDRIGWREIIVRPEGDARVIESNAPTTDLTNELRSYPANLIQAPLDLRSANFRFDPGTIVVAAQPLTATTSGPTREDGGFSALLRDVNPGPVAIALLFLVALGFGAVHGLAPGHGKSVMAAYLVGTRGRPIDAVLLGLLVTIMHTGSVLVVGLVLLQIGSQSDIAKVYPVLTLLSGLVVLALGSALVIARLRSFRKARIHAAASHHHQHEHERPHTHGIGSHTHDLPQGTAPLSRRGIVILATSGGLLPSPSAVIVLIGAASTDRLGLGIGLIAAFSIGLAATLTAIGLALVYGRGFLERREGGFASALVGLLPVASACALLIAGSVVTLEGIRGL